MFHCSSFIEEGITYNGKHYTLYEATQRQRNLEASIRKQRRRILIDEAMGDEQKLQADQIKGQLLKQEYARFSKAAGLRQQHDRLETVGYNWKQEKAAEKTFEKVFTNQNLPDIIRTEAGDGKVTINSIEKPIEQKHTGKGNPNAILHFDVALTKRQQAVLDSLPDYNSRTVITKSDVNMADLAALTAKTGDEFAMFTKSGERLIVRGNPYMVEITPEEAHRMGIDGYSWSGHTHPV